MAGKQNSPEELKIQRIIGERLQLRMRTLKKSGMRITDESLADALGYEVNSIKNYKNGRQKIKISTLINLSKMLKCDPAYLLGLLPEDEPIRDIHDLESITGLTKEACSTLTSINDPVFMENIFSWFINNGLIDLLMKIDSLTFGIDEVKIGLDFLPKSLKDKILAIVNRHAGSDMTDKDCINIADQIRDIDIKEVKYSNRLLADFDRDFDNSPLKKRIPLGYLETLTADSKTVKKVDKTGVPFMDEYPDFVEHENLYNSACSILSELLKLEQTKKVELFFVSEAFNDLVKAYLNH